jgi:hypothetical protein
MYGLLVKFTLDTIEEVKTIAGIVGVSGGAGGLTCPTGYILQNGACVSTDDGNDVCPPGNSIEDTTVTLSATNKYTSGSAGTTHRYKLNGAPALTVSNAGTFTALPVDILSILWGNETDTSYFGEVTNAVVPCAGTKTFTAQLVQNGSVTINVYTEGGDQINCVAYNESIGTGETPTLKIEMFAENKKGFPHGGVLTLELNGTAFDEQNIVLNLGDLAVTKLTNSPNVHSITNTTNKVISWYVAPFEGTALHTGSITFDADDTYDPGASMDDPVLTFRPYDYSVNENNGGAVEGPAVEDEVNVATFGHKTTKTICVI